MKTLYTCNMLQGGVLWKIDILNMFFFKRDKTKVCDIVCLVRGALVLASGHHSEWVPTPSLCVLLCFLSHLGHLSEKVGAFPFPRQVPFLGRKGKGDLSPAPWPWQNRGKAVLHNTHCGVCVVSKKKNEEKQS